MDLNSKKVRDSTQSNATEEEFDNFMQQVTEIEKIIEKLTSPDVSEQQQGQLLADSVLKNKEDGKNIAEDVELKVTSSRTLINKNLENDAEKDPNEMSKDIFMRTMEKDAKERAHDRQIRNERAKTFQIIGNTAFKEGVFDKAVTFFTKGIEVRKDSSTLWNNRALSYIKLGLYEKALNDCEWVLKIDESNLKALLNSAKCHKYLKNQDKYREFMKLAEERNPQFADFIKEFDEKLNTEECRESLDNSQE